MDYVFVIHYNRLSRSLIRSINNALSLNKTYGRRAFQNYVRKLVKRITSYIKYARDGLGVGAEEAMSQQ